MNDAELARDAVEMGRDACEARLMLRARGVEGREVYPKASSEAWVVILLLSEQEW